MKDGRISGEIDRSVEIGENTLISMMV
jgi:hypothetical protein